MFKHDLVISQHAFDSFKEIIEEVQKSSLIAAERLRHKLLHRLHHIQHHPMESSRKVEIPREEGEIRCSNLMNYRIYYLVTSDKIILMEVVAEKQTSRSAV
ncbi:MAG: type II toxin-antitoxin system RelE/ParE family toxin [Flavobacteriales bacterium]|nr:type II toxin-antitoxin system RelE/ParE family toxin [Flavobacteriales bacterium]